MTLSNKLIENKYLANGIAFLRNLLVSFYCKEALLLQKATKGNNLSKNTELNISVPQFFSLKNKLIKTTASKKTIPY